MNRNQIAADKKEEELQNIINEVRAAKPEPVVYPAVNSVSTAPISHTVPQGKRIHKLRMAILIIVSVFIIGFLLLMGYTFLYSGIHHGMRAGTIPIGGMSQREAKACIDDKAEEKLSGQSVELSIYDQTYPIAVESVTDGLDSKETAQAAYDYTHTGGFWERMGHTLQALFAHHTIPLTVTISHDELAARLDEISAEAMTEPVNPTWSIDGDTMTVDRGKEGVDFNRSVVDEAVTEKIRTLDFTPYEVSVEVKAQEAIDMTKIKAEADTEPKNATVDKTDGKTIVPSVDGVSVDAEAAQKIVDASEQQTYSIPITRTPAKINAEALSAVLFRDTLGSASTSYRSSSSDRATNVRLSTEHCNGIILNPGDTFSYNDAVGERTAARGFKEAGAYSNGETVQEVGGGVCQPSSTLYMAVLRADLEVVQRQNHSYVSSYTPLGEDATVSWGGPDFKFRNNTDYPVKIIADPSDRTVLFKILGTNVTGKTVKTDREIVATYSPQTIQKEDSSLPAGTSKVKQSAHTGYKVKVYKNITENGQTTRVLANTSTYRKTDKIILVGTKQSGNANDA